MKTKILSSQKWAFKSEVKMGRGSSINGRVHKKVVEYFENNVLQNQIAKAFQISSPTVNIIEHGVKYMELLLLQLIDNYC